MAKVLKSVAVVAGVVALSMAFPGIAPALGISQATAGTIASVASAVSCAKADCAPLKRKAPA